MKCHSVVYLALAGMLIIGVKTAAADIRLGNDKLSSERRIVADRGADSLSRRGMSRNISFGSSQTPNIHSCWSNKKSDCPFASEMPNERPTGPERRPGAALLQGGETFQDAHIISSLPFADTGNTVGYRDDYSGGCGYNDGAPDVVYTFSPGRDLLLSIHLCNTYPIWDSRVYVYENSESYEIACDDNSCNILMSGLEALPLTTGNTYYIVVDGTGGRYESGHYIIEIFEFIECVASPPPGSYPEGEPDCGPDYIDTYNGGCNSIPPVFQDVNIGDIIFGSSGTYVYGGEEYRDTDWYRIQIDSRSLLTWSVIAEFHPLIFIMDTGSENCQDWQELEMRSSVSCDSISVTALVEPGVYWLWVGPLEFSGWSCPRHYVASIATAPFTLTPDVQVNLPEQLPFADSFQTTCGRGNDLHRTCLGGYDEGEEIVYQLDISSQVLLDISMDPLGTQWTGMLIDNSFPPSPSSCIADAGDGSGNPYGFESLLLQAGTYYIMIDSWPEPYCISEFNLTIQAAPPLQPGDWCDDPFPIDQIPFSDSGNSCQFTDQCALESPDSRDIIYQLNIPQQRNLVMSLCASSYDTKLAVYRDMCCSGPSTEFLYDDEGCGSQSEVRGILDPGGYYIVVDGFMGACGEYRLDIYDAPVCEVVPPPSAINEGEESCGPGYFDNYNGGCNSLPPVFQMLEPGDVIFGTSGTFESSGIQVRDTDWYRIQIDEMGIIKWRAVADFPVSICLIDAGSEDCSDFEVMSMANGLPCDTAEVSAEVEGGVYWLWIAPTSYTAWPCPRYYVAFADCQLGSPILEVTPFAIEGSAQTGGYDDEILTIDNIGGGILDFQIVVDQEQLPIPARSMGPVKGKNGKATSRAGINAGATMPMQGGDDISTATPIASIPYFDEGTTVAYLNDYQGPCGIDNGAPDVVYAYNPPREETLSVSLCSTPYEWDSRLYIFENVGSNPVACDDDGCGNSLSEISGLVVRPGNTYYIVVDGYDNAEGDYSLSIIYASICTVEIPPNSTLEGEPDCGPGYQDHYNGGCYSVPPVFSSIEFGQWLCGRTGTFDDVWVDNDWYSFTLTSFSNINCKLVADIPVMMTLFDVGSGNCQDYQIIQSANAEACDTARVGAILQPGNYWLLIRPTFWSGYPCPKDYCLLIDTQTPWLSVDMNEGELAGDDPPLPITVHMDAANLLEGSYSGSLTIYSNDHNTPELTVPVEFDVVEGCHYIPGDINGNGYANGIDVTYGVTYFKGGNLPPVDCVPPCIGVPDPFFAAGDVNGNCQFNGIDITYFVAYLKGLQPMIQWCEDCPPIQGR